MHFQTLLLALTTAVAVNATTSAPLLPTPPMGFNNWARFECALNESLFTATADAMLSKGLLAAGYNRLNIDDCWPLHSRSSNGSLQWDPDKFPHGLIWLGQYLKEKGFKFGIYSDAGNLTCGGYPGSLGYEEIDAATFASWGIDYLKLDGCYVSSAHSGGLEQAYKTIYSHWHKVLSAMPNLLIFSESAPAYFSGQQNLTDWYTVMDWVPRYGQLARHSDDIPTVDDSAAWMGIMTDYNYELLLARYQRPGYFNDPDFLIVDHGNLTIDEKKSHFALWASFSAPLIISAYVPDLTDEEVEYLTNEELIAVDQDVLGVQATLVSRDATFDVLTKSLSNGDRLLTVLNRGPGTASISVPMERIGYPASTFSTAKDLWTGDSKPVFGKVDVSLKSHATAVYRISTNKTLAESVVPTGLLFNTASTQCLTAGEILGWANCTGSDEQVWQVKKDGSVSSLSAPTECLSGKDGSVGMVVCMCGVTEQS